MRQLRCCFPFSRMASPHKVPSMMEIISLEETHQTYAALKLTTPTKLEQGLAPIITASGFPLSNAIARPRAQHKKRTPLILFQLLFIHTAPSDAPTNTTQEASELKATRSAHIFTCSSNRGIHSPEPGKHYPQRRACLMPSLRYRSTGCQTLAEQSIL